MNPNQIVTIQIEADSDLKKWNNHPTLISGVVVNVNGKTATVEMDTSSVRGFHPTTIDQFTLRKNNKWVRIGCMMNRGWSIK